MSNLRKHKTLKLLADYRREKSLQPTNYTVLGYSLSVEEINDKLKYPTREIVIICDSFVSLGFAEIVTFDRQPDIVRYYVTEEGEHALYSKFFLSKLWYKDSRFWIPLVVSVIAILFPIGLYIYDTPKIERIEKLEKEVDSLHTELRLTNERMPKSKP